jgi:adenylylsulfate kinase
MSEPKSKNIVWSESQIAPAQREAILGHKPATLWFTGLSGAGKSTVALATEVALVERGVNAFILDGDNVRHGLNNNLGFSPADRTENIRRIGEVCKLFCDAGNIVFSAFISPYREDRDLVREKHPAGSFIEVHVHAPLEVCESRDVKGLYKKARAGEIPEFTGISAPYEAPENAELIVNTAENDLDACVAIVIKHLEDNGFIPAK